MFGLHHGLRFGVAVQPGAEFVPQAPQALRLAGPVLVDARLPLVVDLLVHYVGEAAPLADHRRLNSVPTSSPFHTKSNTKRVTSSSAFSEMTMQPARHKCHACCLSKAENRDLHPVSITLVSIGLIIVSESSQGLLTRSVNLIHAHNLS